MPATIRKKSAVAMVTGKGPVESLYRAVIRYVEANGGSLAVIGGIQIEQWPGELSGNFTVAVKCTGVRPKFTKREGRC
jgi:hypothetical protein